MFSYTDLNGLGVELSFKKEAFSMEATHVLALAKYNDKWLLTKHPIRGLEFPGGKVEPGETLEQAVKREVYEETGATVDHLTWFATYVVQDKRPFAKAVYLADVTTIEWDHEWQETEGALFLTDEELKENTSLSFYMKDNGMKKMLEKVRELEHKW